MVVDQGVIIVEQNIDWFSRPPSTLLNNFFEIHPIQTTRDPIIVKSFVRKNGTNRKWLSYSEGNDALYCSICLAFLPTVVMSSFVCGMANRRHIHQRVDEHEKPASHNECTENYFQHVSRSNVSNLLFSTQISVHREQVQKQRLVLLRVIEIIKVIGKRGHSYRGHEFEAAYTLSDNSIDRGNFLEMVLLTDSCIEQSEKRKNAGSTGRGSMVTFLSKTTITKLIQITSRSIQQIIAKEINSACMFSVQIDTTEDITNKNQCSIVVRYVTDQIHERLLTMIACDSSTGEYLWSLVSETLKTLNIDILKCVGNSTDGAANMNGEYNGFAAWMFKENPNQIHVWCYAHVLNLVISDTCNVVLSSISLFNLLNDVAVFIRGSYKRMNIFETENQNDIHNRRISTIGETRWWSKDAALTKIFGTFANLHSSFYVELVVALSHIEDNLSFKSEVPVKAKGFKEGLLKYDTILTAQIFLRVFQLTTPLSKYLQTVNMDILVAYNMVPKTIDTLKKYLEEFDIVLKATNNFVCKVNEKLEQHELEAENTLPEKRIRKKKVLSGETRPSEFEIHSDVLNSYKVKVHDVIFKRIIESMSKRFKKSQELYADFAILSPSNFEQLKAHSVPTSALNKLSEYLLPFDEEATAKNLRTELTSFASNWNNIKESLLSTYDIMDINKESVEELEYNCRNSCTACENCTVCCYLILIQYNLISEAYANIGLAYKYTLSLPFTQVACERSFSILKFIKNRLRSSMAQENLQSFMLMKKGNSKQS
nr:uncharacterized protein LOC101238791 [Hydra vulgaris]